MVKCKICVRPANDPWVLRVDGEIYEHCSDSCHQPFIGEEAKKWLAQRRRDIKAYQRSFNRGR